MNMGLTVSHLELSLATNGHTMTAWLVHLRPVVVVMAVVGLQANNATKINNWLLYASAHPHCLSREFQAPIGTYYSGHQGYGGSASQLRSRTQVANNYRHMG